MTLHAIAARERRQTARVQWFGVFAAKRRIGLRAVLLVARTGWRRTRAAEDSGSILEKARGRDIEIDAFINTFVLMTLCTDSFEFDGLSVLLKCSYIR